MSDEEKQEEQEKREIATNRLLELLRAQQVGRPAPEESASPEEESAPSRKGRFDKAKEQSGEPLETQAETDKEDGRKSLLALLSKKTHAEAIGETLEAELESAAKTEVIEEETEVSPKDGVIEETVEAEEAQAPVGEDLLEFIKQKPAEPEIPEEEIAPYEFDGSLYSFLPDQKRKMGFKDSLYGIYNRFNESKRRISLHRGDVFVRFLQAKVEPAGIVIEKFFDYSLPYIGEDKTIAEMDELESFIIQEHLEKKHRKGIFAGYYGSPINTRTNILQTPKLKSKELVDLVQWNAKRNLPFNAEKAVITWEVTNAVRDPNKQNIVMGIADGEPLEKTISHFNKEYKLKLRLFSTIPILQWKLFVRNYPDRDKGCYLLVHIGEKHTSVVVVEEHKLLFTRDIALGAEDFYKAAMQKVVIGEEAIEINYAQAKQILRDYGFPKEGKGVIQGTRISLYKVSIFLRPMIERLTGEINRSMAYFKKQSPTLECQEILFEGIGATFPHVVRTLGENLNMKAELMNPLRVGKVKYTNGTVISDRQLPNYALSLGLIAQEAEKLNVLPKKVRSSYVFIFLYKVAFLLIAFCLPIFIGSIFLSNNKIEYLKQKIQQRTDQWNRLSEEQKGYLSYMNDVEILSGFRRFLINDRILSKNQIAIMGYLSSAVSEEIKFTSLVFKKDVDKSSSQPQGQSGSTGSPKEQYNDVLDVEGFVQSDPAVADIHLTNFVIRLENLGIFSTVSMEMNQNPNKTKEGKLFFTLRLRSR